MTLTELSYKFFKAHICMGLGCALGLRIAQWNSIRHPIIFGALAGLLLSLHLYLQCIRVLCKEYKQLKFKNKDEN